MEWCRMEGERSSECRKEEVRRRAGGDGGEDGWREQQRAGGSDWISTVCGQWTWGNEVRRLRDCKRGCVCTIKEKGKKKRMLVEITAVTSNGHSCSSCHKIASSYFPFLPVHSSVFYGYHCCPVSVRDFFSWLLLWLFSKLTLRTAARDCYVKEIVVCVLGESSLMTLHSEWSSASWLNSAQREE